MQKTTRVIRTDYIGKKRAADIRGLIACVNRADGTHYGMADAADLYCFVYDGENVLRACLSAYRMGEGRNGRQVIEIAAFTDPQYRGQGYFRQMLHRIRAELEGAVLRFAVYRTALSDSIISHLQARHDHDELLMAGDLGTLAGNTAEATPTRRRTQEVSGSENSDPAVAAAHEPPVSAPENGKAETSRKHEITVSIDEADGKAYTEGSECYFYLFGEKAYLFGVMTYANYRRRGYAGAMLRALFADLYRRGVRELSLQVSSENEAALALYRGLGLTESDRLSYYYLESGK